MKTIATSEIVKLENMDAHAIICFLIFSNSEKTHERLGVPVPA
jgi:hypothetical protein